MQHSTPPPYLHTQKKNDNLFAFLFAFPFFPGAELLFLFLYCSFFSAWGGHFLRITIISEGLQREPHRPTLVCTECTHIRAATVVGVLYFKRKWGFRLLSCSALLTIVEISLYPILLGKRQGLIGPKKCMRGDDQSKPRGNEFYFLRQFFPYKQAFLFAEMKPRIVIAPHPLLWYVSFRLELSYCGWFFVGILVM